MSGLVLTNNARSTLAAAVATTDTSISLKAGDGALFPVIGSGQWHPLTLLHADGTFEIVKVTARATDTLTVTRGQEGTTAQAFNAGDMVELRLTTAAMNDLINGVASLQANKLDATANAVSATKIQGADTRATNNPPSDFKLGVNFDFKQHASIALGDQSTGNYAGVLTLAPWTDFSGGGNHQLAFDVGGSFYHRYGDANGWQAWNQLWHSGNLTKVSQLTNDSAYITAGGAPVQSVAGKTGAVTLANTDISGLGTASTHAATDFLAAGAQATDSAKLNGQLPSYYATASSVPTNNNQLTNGAGYITAGGAPVQSVAGKTGAVTLTSADVGLGNVNNTADSTKSVANAVTWNGANKTVSTAAPSGGANGDVWFQYS